MIQQLSPRGRMLLVFPEARANYGSGDLKREDIKVDELGAVYPPLGPLYVASALLQAGFEARFVDFSVRPYSIAELRRHLEGCNLIGLHTQSHYRESTTRIARDARILVPGIRVIAGGPDVTIFRTLLDGVDAAMTGDVETSVASVADALQKGRDLGGLPGVIYRSPNGIVHTDELPVREDLGSIAWPSRHLVNREDYSLFGGFRRRTTSLITGRGCTGSCRFCARRAYSYFRYRPRPVDDVLDEIEQVYREGYRFLYITDDNLLADRDRALAIMDGIVSRGIRMYLKIVARVDRADPDLYRGLARAGVRFVDFGLESACQEVLDFYGKGVAVEQNRRAVELASEYGIFIHAHVIVGGPLDDRERVQRTIDLVKSLPIHTVFFNVLGYRKGSSLWQDAQAQGLVDDNEEVVVAMRERALGPFSRPELIEIHGRAVREFYLRPAYVWQVFRKLAAIRDPELAMALARIAGTAALRVTRRALGLTMRGPERTDRG